MEDVDTIGVNAILLERKAVLAVSASILLAEDDLSSLSAVQVGLVVAVEVEPDADNGPVGLVANREVEDYDLLRVDTAGLGRGSSQNRGAEGNDGSESETHFDVCLEK